ncbi:MAG: hypothetical protein IKY83_06780 [Proteobacteria bacterium]|nr:hypothetical protein [Pseudomonadota bacterium]
MSMEREAEVLEMPKHSDNTVIHAKKIAQGRAAIERYVERLENATERLKTGPEAAELYCALAELREGMIETDLEQAASLYQKALNSFRLSSVANAGQKRLSRAKGDTDALIAALEREFANARPEQKRDIQLELVRTHLYAANDPEKAIAILESMDKADSEASTIVPETENAFDPELFLLWEDALIATYAWDRYEGKLWQALRQQRSASAITQHLEEKLWMLYRFIMPDESQAQILSRHLVETLPLDDELVNDQLQRALKKDDIDATAAILDRAIERLGNSPKIQFYRSLLADISQFRFEDREHAIDVLSATGEDTNLIHLHQLTLLLKDCGRADGLLDTLARTLEFVSTPELKADQLYQIACIFRDEIEDQLDTAIDVFCEANKLCPTHEPTIEALAEYYTFQGEWELLAQLFEDEIEDATRHQRVDYSPEVFISRHARLARLYEDKLHFALKAFNHYQAILKFRADDIDALKGASRMAQSIGNWPELLQLYADAEGCTLDTHEHIFLLEKIAQIADVYLNDADTACTALEALRDIGATHDTTTASLARLYLKLKKWDDLIALTDEEIENAENPEYKATLLCRNAEISENALANIPQAILYYEKARAAFSACRTAADALERLYARQKAWEKLTALLKSLVDLTPDSKLKGAKLRKLANILNQKLNLETEAVEIYENALRVNPQDTVSKYFLIDYYRSHAKWDDIIRILKVDSNLDGTLGAKWLSHFWIGRIELYHRNNPENALDAFRKAFLDAPDDLILFHTWLSLSLRAGDPQETLKTLQEARLEIGYEQTRVEIELAVADLTLRLTNDPKSIESLLLSFESSNQLKNVRFLNAMKTAVSSANGCWHTYLAPCLQNRQPREIQRHALLASLALNFPDEIAARSQETLCQLQDLALAKKIWVALEPSKRPAYKNIPKQLLLDPSHEAQDLRRWASISRLLDGNISDPTDLLLPDDRCETISYRPDLELLAAYFEKFEKWENLLEVLNVQEENTLNEQEAIQVTLQRAWVLTKINRPEDALKCVQKACLQCSFNNPMRLSLYDYLGREKDWDFLSEQIRQHLMNTDDNAEKAALCLRLADISRNGINNLLECLRWLNEAYQNDQTRGSILCDISETAQALGEFEIARRALDDYIQRHEPSLDEQLALEPRLLELHFNCPGGDTQRMIAYFDYLAKQTIQSRDCLIILAKAHAIAGDPNVAAELLLRVIDYPFRNEDLQLWILLGDLYLDKLGEQQKGEELLWELFKSFPCDEYIFGRLNKLYLTPAERKIMVVNIQNAVAQSKIIASDASLIRKYLGFAAQILGSELGAWKDAQELYSKALDASPEPEQELVKNRAYARCRIPGESNSAYREFCDLLIHDPFQPDIYRAAFEICKRNDARDRERILKQLAAVFLPDEGLSENTDLRPKLMDSRPLNDDILLKYLSHPNLRPVQTMLHEAMPLLNDCLRDNVPKRPTLGGDKIKVPYIQNIFSMCASAFGISNIKGFNSHDDTPVPTVLDDPEAYWISLEIWETMKPEMQRHWAGYASGLLWTGISKLAFFDPREVWRLLDGIYYLVTKGQGITERNAYTIEASERINKHPFRSGIRRDVARFIDEIGPENIPITVAPKWLEGLYATADRAGLLFSGSLAASIPAILQAEGWNPNKTSTEYLAARFKLSKRLPKLIAFALSDDYLQLRYHAGLALTPSKISG